MLRFNRAGRDIDPFKGNCIFISFIHRNGYCLVALRWRWQLRRWSRFAGGHCRWYIGPFEFEWIDVRPKDPEAA